MDERQLPVPVVTDVARDPSILRVSHRVYKQTEQEWFARLTKPGSGGVAILYDPPRGSVAESAAANPPRGLFL